MSPQDYPPSLTVTMTNIELRDWFAGMALQGNLGTQKSGYSYGGRWNDAAIEAYQIADAMIAARERKEDA